ncbi:MAG: trypsin-like peptidase domain-containing protein [Clostridia bacterium]|nr:trypsin-like peptidase domain-containing protein [Clostridia bacterium]
MKKRSLVVIICILVLAASLSLTACSGLFSSSAEPSRSYIDIGKVDDPRTASIVANNTMESCVRVITEYKSGLTSASSGFVITEDGYVLTNRHCVVRFNSTGSDTTGNVGEQPMTASYSVVFADNREYSAKLVAYSSSVDIALLKIATINLPFISNEKRFQPVVLETEEELYYGERVYAIGNPENIGLILTELTIASPAIKLNKADDFDSVILDGNINHGNSGGPIFNAYSRVSGIVYARIEGTNKDTYGIGCAISTDMIIAFLESVEHAKINYKTTPVSSSGEAAA